MKWLKMDCDAQENLDMRKLVSEWGWEWYGRYWAILGKIGMLVTDKCQTFALHTNNGEPFPVKLLADDLGTTVERLTTFCDYLSDNHLIDPKAWKGEKLIYTPKLRERADEYTAKLLTKSRRTPDTLRSKKKIRRRLEIEEDKNRDRTPIPSSLDDVKKLWEERKYPTTECEKFFNYYSANGWRVGKNPMKDWRAAAAGWVSRANDYAAQRGESLVSETKEERTKRIRRMAGLPEVE